MEGRGRVKLLSVEKAKILFREYLKGLGYKPKTLHTILSSLDVLKRYLNDKVHTKDLRDITREDLVSYVSYLREVKSERTQKRLSNATVRKRFYDVSQLFRYLYFAEMILTNPSQGIELKTRGEVGRRAILSREEMNRFLDGIEIGDMVGLRDRAMFELLYSSGLRVSEASNLKTGDIDMEGRMVMVRRGKMGKDRVEPVSEVAMKFVRKYVEGREEEKESPVFERVCGGKMSGGAVGARFRKHAERAGIKREGVSAHSIRHSIATQLLENGADIRYVQELLGHESIETTVRYTHALYENMKKVYKRYHPRENEYYKEITAEYRERIEEFKREAERVAKERVRKRRWREGKRKEIEKRGERE